MNKPIETTGDIRSMLIGMMEKIEKGEMKIDQAAQITKVAAQINESIYAEIKVARMSIDAGEKKSAFGKLKVAGDE